ncbi:MAG: T9SS type A sorting domain-containing protein [Bacteroidota bacterium]
MKQNILLVLALFSFSVLSAQQMEFTVSPVIVNGITADDFEGVGYSLLHNSASETRDFRWNMTVLETDGGWTAALCDKNLCHDVSVTSEEFFLEADSSGRMDVHAYTGFRDGSAVVEIVVTDIADETQQASNIYYFNTDPTNTKEVTTLPIKVYPNPSNGLFAIKGSDSDIAQVEVFSLAGTRVKSFTYGDGQWYDISDLPRGTYLVRLVDRNAQQLVTKLMNKL